MAYVDLNPARAAMCDTLADSEYTSIQRRLRERATCSKKGNPDQSSIDRPLKPVAGLDANSLLEMTESSYIDIVQWTGEQVRSDKRGVLKPLGKEDRRAPSDLRNMSSHPKQWLRQVQGTESIYYRAIGSAEALMAKAEALEQASMKGISGELARKILRERPT